MKRATDFNYKPYRITSPVFFKFQFLIIMDIKYYFTLVSSYLFYIGIHHSD